MPNRSGHFNPADRITMPPTLVFLCDIGFSRKAGVAFFSIRNALPQHSGSLQETQLGLGRTKCAFSPGLPGFLVFRIWFIAQIPSLRLCWRRSGFWLSFPIHPHFSDRFRGGRLYSLLPFRQVLAGALQGFVNFIGWPHSRASGVPNDHSPALRQVVRRPLHRIPSRGGCVGSGRGIGGWR